jgi:hypothetical protein
MFGSGYENYPELICSARMDFSEEFHIEGEA